MRGMNRTMTRRKFLRGALALPMISVAGCFRATGQRGMAGVDAGGRQKSVIIVGAGLAGLAAGYELARAGHAVTILEARSRPGGRVQTVREPFADGLYAEAGALFIPDNHDVTLKYVRLFDLPLVRVHQRATGKLYYVRGRRLVATTGAQLSWPFSLTPEEQRLGRGGMWQKYVTSVARQLGDVTAPGWPSAEQLDQYDRLDGVEFLRQQGASPGAVDLLRLGYFDLSGDGLGSNSALFMLRDVALQQSAKETFSIAGGNDQLPKAFAARLKEVIRYDSPVVRIENGDTSAAVVVRHAGRYERLRADRVVCAIPFSVLRRLEVSPSFSAPKRTAIDGVPYTSVVRTFLQVRQRVWDLEGLPNSVTTDRPVKWIWEPTLNQPGPRGIIESYTAGADARRLAAMQDADRIAFVRREVDAVFHGVAENFETGASKAWDDDEWARGGYSWLRPGQMHSLLPWIARAEGRVHFAGEHTSAWPQWMQGALASGVRVAGEIVAGM